MAARSPTRLAHLHLPSPIPYTHSLRLQKAALARHFAQRDALRSKASSPAPPSPPPTLVTLLHAPNLYRWPPAPPNQPHLRARQSFLTHTHTLTSTSSGSQAAAAEFHPSPRGGLLTYHAPGKLTAYPIIDLHLHGIWPRCYVRLLENSVTRTCARFGVPNVGVSEDPGVWILDSETGKIAIDHNHSHHERGNVNEDGEGDRENGAGRKICGVGVQVSRGITSHGIGLNVFDARIPREKRSLYNLPRSTKNCDGHGNLEVEAEGYPSWGFWRIAACGLKGKSVTWLSREQQSSSSSPSPTSSSSSFSSFPQTLDVSSSFSISGVAAVFAEEFARGLSDQGKEPVQGVMKLKSEDDILRTDIGWSRILVSNRSGIDTMVLILIVGKRGRVRAVDEEDQEE